MSERRIEIVLKDPNPLFTGWLSDWLGEAERKDLRSKHALREALESLKRYPLPLQSGRECAVLKGFGPKLCSLLHEKLMEYKNSHVEEYNKSLNYGEDIMRIAKKISKRRQPKKAAALTRRKVTDTELLDDQVIMSPGSFKIVLLVDTQETIGKHKKTLDKALVYLDNEKISYQVRRLGAGDFCWICVDDANRELILPYIIERKRMDDFASSIRDGRFHEQKFRLRDSNIQNLIYLIENYGSNQHLGLPITTLLQAATNTQIHSGFQMKFTDSHSDSLLYIATLTRILIDQFQNKTLIGTTKEEIKPYDIVGSMFIGLMKFSEFNEQSSKNRHFKVREIFIKQLLQLKSLSVDKALAITKIYPTPRSLISAYRACATVDEGEKLLSKIPSGVLKRPIGLSISKIMYQFYNSS